MSPNHRRRQGTGEGATPPISSLNGAPPDRANIARSMSHTAIGHGIGQLAWFGSLIVLGALLSPESFGTVTAGLVIVNIGTLLMGAGTGGSIVSSGDLAPSEVRSALRLNLAIGVVLTVALVVLAEPVTEAFAAGGDPTVLRWLALGIGFYSVSVVPVALLKKGLRFGRYALITIASTTAAGLTAIALGFAGAGVWALVARLLLFHGLTAVLAVAATWKLLARRREATGGGAGAKRSGGSWFFLMAVADFVAFNADYLVVGRVTEAERLGLYSLAFTLAFAPLRQFSWQIGSVLFAASASTTDLAAVRRQLTTSLRLVATLLLPLAIPAVVVAPVLLPAVLGERWEPMVPTFQVLVVVGIGHGLLNIGTEFLSGTGNADLRGRASVAWASGMVVALVVLVPAFGILGAALAHALMLVPLTAVYATRGARRLGARPRDLALPLQAVALAVMAQGAVTLVLFVALQAVGTENGWAAVMSAVGGWAAAVLLLARGPDAPLLQVWRAVRMARQQQTTQVARP